MMLLHRSLRLIHLFLNSWKLVLFPVLIALLSIAPSLELKAQEISDESYSDFDDPFADDPFIDDPFADDPFANEELAAPVEPQAASSPQQTSNRLPQTATSQSQARRQSDPIDSALIAESVAELDDRERQLQEREERLERKEEDQRLRTEATLKLIRESSAKIQQAISLRAEALTLAEKIKTANQKIALLEQTKRLEQLSQPDTPINQSVEFSGVRFFPVKRITGLRLGSRPRARIRINRTGQDEEITVREGTEITYEKGSDIGSWKVISISREGVQFSHSDSTVEPRYVLRD
ncbi:MAG: hypothetical protein ACR2PW_07620 [Gammaproteobacteria bacterium]